MSEQTRGRPHKRCDCGICRISSQLLAEKPDLSAIGDGVDWMLDRWCDDSMRLSHILHAIEGELEDGASLPAGIVDAFTLAAEGTALARRSV